MMTESGRNSCVTVDNVIYHTDETRGVVLGYVDGSEVVQIKDEILNAKIIAISSGSCVCDSLQKVFIPASVEIIDDNAFMKCVNLCEVIFVGESRLRIIDSSAFSLCKLREFVCPNSIQELGRFAFSGCACLESFVVAGADTDRTSLSIQAACFEKCRNLKSFVCMKGKVEFGTSAFYGCESLVEFKLNPKCKLGLWGANTFRYCKIENFELPHDIYFDRITFEGMVNVTVNDHRFVQENDFIFNTDKSILLKYTGRDADVVIPKHVEGLRMGCFNHNQYVKRIRFESDSVLDFIETSVFLGCNVESLYLPPSIRSFGGINMNIDNVVIEIGCPNLTVDDNLILTTDCRKLKFCFGRISSITIPSFVVSIEGMCFCANKTLREVHFEEGSELEKIGSAAFRESNLTEIEIPKLVTEIGMNAFRLCSCLKRVTFDVDSKLEVIGTGNFAECPSLNEIVLPNSLKVIGKIALASAGLQSISIPSSVENICEQCFVGCGNLSTISFGDNPMCTHLTTGLFRNSGIASICIPRSIKVMEYECFAFCAKLKEVTFEKNSELEVIEDKTFRGTSLDQICLPKGVTTIGDLAFAQCRNLRKVSFESDAVIQHLMNSSIFADSDLVVLEIPESVKYVNQDLLASVTAVDVHGNPYISHVDQELCIPASVTYLEDSEYANTAVQCASFESPCSIQILPISLFTNSLLESITIPNTIIEIREACFAGCKHLKLVEFEENAVLDSIMNECFKGCGIEEIFFPDSVQQIGRNCFSDCIQLRRVNFGMNSQLFRVGGEAFSGTEKLKQICFPVKVVEVHPGCFNNSGLEICKFDPDGQMEEFRDEIFNSPTIVYLPKCTRIIDGKVLKNIKELYLADDSPYLCMKNSIVMDANQRKIFGTTNHSMKSLTIPNSVHSIGAHAFESVSLEELIFEDNSTLQSIEEGAFAKTSIISLSLPTALRKMGKQCFGECLKLREVRFADDCQVTDIDGCFDGCNCDYIYLSQNVSNVSSSSLICFKRVEISENNSSLRIENNCLIDAEGTLISTVSRDIDIQLPNGITRLAGKSLSYVSYVTMKNCLSLNILGMNAFEECQIKRITIPRNVRVIQSQCFMNSTIEFVFFESQSQLEVIESCAFAYCSLVQLEIPKKVREIGFQNIKRVREIVVETGNTSFILHDNVLMSISDQRVVLRTGDNIPSGILTLPSYIKSFNHQYILYGQFSMVDLRNGTLEELGYCAFCGASVYSLVIPSTVRYIRSQCFRCSKIKHVTFELPSKVEVFDESMFDESSLESILIPNSVKEIMPYCFSSCHQLREVEFEDNSSLKYIHACAFYSSKGLTSIVLPKSVRYIGDNSFRDCDNLESVIVETGSELRSIGDSAFYTDSSTLREFRLPITVENVGEYAFHPCCPLMVDDTGEITNPELQSWCESHYDAPFKAERRDDFYLSSDFKVVKRLGIGSQGSVSLIRHSFTNEEFAVKEFISTNEREFDIMKRLQHPCIINIVGFSRTSICMEYASNGSLENAIHGNCEWLDSTAKAKIIVGVSLGMSAMHDKNIVHRDLKPSNIVIDGNHVPKICDFGSAKQENGNDSHTILIGTRFYMAPEMYDDVSEKTNKIDVFSFGLIMYEVIEGMYAISRDLDSAGVMKIVKSGIHLQFNNCTHEPIQNLILRCLEVDSRNRPSFAEIIDILHQEDFLISDDVDLDSVCAFMTELQTPSADAESS